MSFAGFILGVPAFILVLLGMTLATGVMCLVVWLKGSTPEEQRRFGTIVSLFVGTSLIVGGLAGVGQDLIVWLVESPLGYGFLWVAGVLNLSHALVSLANHGRTKRELYGSNSIRIFTFRIATSEESYDRVTYCLLAVALTMTYPIEYVRDLWDARFMPFQDEALDRKVTYLRVLDRARGIQDDIETVE